MSTELQKINPQPVAEVATVGSMLAVIDRAAKDPSVDVEKMERLLALAERMEERKAKSEYDQAINAAQSEMRPISRDCHNPQTRSRYASYEAIDTAIRPIYTAHGFGMSFGSKAASSPDRVMVTCRISHRAGHTETVELEMPADGKGAKGGDVMTKTHAVGSGLSYGKRYLCNLIWNLSFGEQDDDGNAASPRQSNRSTQYANQPAKTPEKPVSTPKQANSADVLPKTATASTRKWMLDGFYMIGGFNGQSVLAYAIANGILKDGQPETDWPLDKVPTSKAGLNALIADIGKWLEPSPENTEGESFEGSEPQNPGMPEEIFHAVITLPRKGMKRADYLANPDTIGALYMAAKGGDQEAAQRLFGVAGNWHPEPRTVGDKTYPVSKEDAQSRAMLDAFMDWHDKKNESKNDFNP